MNDIFFFQIKQILDPTIIFDQFKKQNIFFSYFQVNQEYYLLCYAQESIEIDFLYKVVDVIQEVDSNKRKIRSMRGFLIYALKTINNKETDKDFKVLSTNLKSSFWGKVEKTIRQNKKGALQELLFETEQMQSFQIIVNLQDSFTFLNSLEESLPNFRKQTIFLHFLKQSLQSFKDKITSILVEVSRLENISKREQEEQLARSRGQV